MSNDRPSDAEWRNWLTLDEIAELELWLFRRARIAERAAKCRIRLQNRANHRKRKAAERDVNA